MANKIIQLKDSQGNNLYPVMTCNIDELASGTGIEKRKLLWTNASPTSNFAAQALTSSDFIGGLDLSSFQFIEIHFIASTSYNSNVVRTVAVGQVINAQIVTDVTTAYTMYVAQRAASTSSSGITFEDAYYKSVTSTAVGAKNNNRLVPYKIYGIKGV